MRNSVNRAITVVIMITCFTGIINAQIQQDPEKSLNVKQQNIITISAYTAIGDLKQLKTELNNGLEAGLTINQIKEVIVHLYAYCGFPRSIRGLQTFMEVLDERKANGIIDEKGIESTQVTHTTSSKYERGERNLERLTGKPLSDSKSGYAAFAPVIEVFLKEHLFADLFDRDVLTFAERELVTISVISAIGNAEPMLRSHLTICRNLGFTTQQLNEFDTIIKSTLGDKEPELASGFPKGQLVNSINFSGKVWLNMMGVQDSSLYASYGNVTFEPRARTNWHLHPGGQILFITEGEGYYQAKGQPAKLLRKGDYVEIPANVVHWHGADQDSLFAHIAVSLNTDKGGAVWLGPVTEVEYNKAIK